MTYRGISAVAEPSVNLLGPDAVRKALVVQQDQAARDAWPYRHCYPPVNAVRVFAWGVIAAPAAATPTVVTSQTNTDLGTFRVDTGFQCWITEVVFQFVGPAGMFVPGSGDILWTWDVNTPLSATPLQGSNIQDFYQVPFPVPLAIPGLGVVIDGQLQMPERFKSGDVLRSKVTTTNVITAGAPQFFISIFKGWKWPATE